MSSIAPHPYTGARFINPDAGDHVIGAHPAELAAADQATRRSWREFPYYPRRYGARGRRFSLSDSGWITTLCDLPPAAARRQIRWLGGVLSTRGMPQCLLERHLGWLHEELTGALPDEAAHYAALLHCADELRAMRRGALPDEAFFALAAEFDDRTRGLEGAVRNMGVVVVGAVADERAGIAGAVEAVGAWACDPERFPEPWIAAVRATTAAARER